MKTKEAIIFHFFRQMEVVVDLFDLKVFGTSYHTHTTALAF